jgi:hypothetical protein
MLGMAGVVNCFFRPAVRRLRRKRQAAGSGLNCGEKHYEQGFVIAFFAASGARPAIDWNVVAVQVRDVITKSSSGVGV